MNYTQFPDLTEITYFYGGYDSVLLHQQLQEIKLIPTEFMFYLGSPSHFPDSPPQVGLKPVAAMNNWWPSHHNSARKLVLYWARNPNYNPDTSVLPTRKVWCEYANLAASGCGLKIGVPPMRTKLFNRYFTLFRMPVKVSRVQEKWLTLHNYTHLDTGKLASYYVNGWNPETYDKNVEFAHFKLNEQEYIKNGDGNGNRF